MNTRMNTDDERDEQLKLLAPPPPKPVNKWQGSDSDDDLDVPDGDESPQTQPQTLHDLRLSLQVVVCAPFVRLV